MARLNCENKWNRGNCLEGSLKIMLGNQDSTSCIENNLEQSDKRLRRQILRRI